ncbi:MAG: hypothetical protein ACHQ1D_00760 [Nitrososphaerales archaeon]
MSVWKRLKGVFFFIPTYGFYGAPHYGCGREDKEGGHCPTPIDWMDNLFKLHDERKITDKQLVDMCKAGDVKQLYAVRTNQPWYKQMEAKFYRQLVINWFSVQSKITDKIGGNLND